MRLTGSRTYYRSTPPRMPSGLVELIEGLTREVLKNNPTDIYGFCAGHMRQLLEIRDGPLQKKTLTLEEKIARAQEKVRQRAEQRRQRYDMDLLKQQSDKEPDINAILIKKDTSLILPHEPTGVPIPNAPSQNEQTLPNLSEAELSQKLCSQNENPQLQDIKDFSINDNGDFKNDVILEPKDKDHNSKSNINLTESSNEISDSMLTQDTSPNELSYTDRKAEMLESLGALTVDEDKTQLETQSPQEEQELVAEVGVLREFDTSSNSSSNPDQHLSNMINSINTNQDSPLIHRENITINSSEPEKTADLDGQNSVTQVVNLFSNDIVETQSDNVDLPLNKKEAQSNNTQSIQQIIDPDITNRSNIVDEVESNTNSDDTVNRNEEDPQEINTFDISFKESPTVELQDPQLNSDMLDSLQTNSDSDIVTLITPDSTNDYLKEHQAKSLDIIENINKENDDFDNSGQEYPSTNLSETPQIHDQDSNMDLETAAVTIQKVFRTFLFKSRASTFDDTANDETIFLNEVEKNKSESVFPIASSLNERRPHGITRMDTVLQTVNEEKSLSLSTDDSSTMSSAATVIQAHVRGFLVRNKLNSNKTVSTNSLATSNSIEPSLTSLEMDNEQNKNKTVLNIHIVPEGGNYLSRDESLITSMDLSLDSSPPSSINLHPLGYDKSERRKQLKREDAIQSISPPSNNSGKLSEDVDSVKELPLNDHEITEERQAENAKEGLHESTSVEEGREQTHVENMTIETVGCDNAESETKQKESVEKNNSDEMDVVTPFISNGDNNSSDHNLMHSGEFHDAVLPTKVSRSDTSVASEFKNVLVYFLLWNHS